MKKLFEELKIFEAGMVTINLGSREKAIQFITRLSAAPETGVRMSHNVFRIGPNVNIDSSVFDNMWVQVIFKEFGIEL